MTDESPRHLGGHDGERQLVGATGVDAAEQGIDEALDYLPAKPALEGRAGAPLGPARVACPDAAFREVAVRSILLR